MVAQVTSRAVASERRSDGAGHKMARRRWLFLILSLPLCACGLGTGVPGPAQIEAVEARGAVVPRQQDAYRLLPVDEITVEFRLPSNTLPEFRWRGEPIQSYPGNPNERRQLDEKCLPAVREAKLAANGASWAYRIRLPRNLRELDKPGAQAASDGYSACQPYTGAGVVLQLVNTGCAPGTGLESGSSAQPSVVCTPQEVATDLNLRGARTGQIDVPLQLPGPDYRDKPPCYYYMPGGGAFAVPAAGFERVITGISLSEPGHGRILRTPHGEVRVTGEERAVAELNGRSPEGEWFAEGCPDRSSSWTINVRIDWAEA